jgi:hypothetical protein
LKLLSHRIKFTQQLKISSGIYPEIERFKVLKLKIFGKIEKHQNLEKNCVIKK